MKNILIRSAVGISCISLLVLNGCISVPNSPNPRFYMLEAVPENQESKKINTVSNITIGIGPIKIPEYLDRPQMVTQSDEKTLKFAQFDRWGEYLDIGVARLIRENLAAALPSGKYILYPWVSSVPVKYQVTVEIIQLDSQLDRDLFLSAQWTIIDTITSKPLFMKRSEFRKSIMPQNYAGLAKTLSLVCTSVSDEIAQELSILQAPKVD